jgi:hypothetical protein
MCLQPAPTTITFAVILAVAMQRREGKRKSSGRECGQTSGEVVAFVWA